MRSVFSSLVLWRSVVAVASLLRGQFAWGPVYGGQLSRGQLSCTGNFYLKHLSQLFKIILHKIHRNDETLALFFDQAQSSTSSSLIFE